MSSNRHHVLRADGGNRTPFEYECYSCGFEKESFDPPVIPLRDCPECDDVLHHVGPVVAECDECGAELLYPGNPGLGGYRNETLCDTCYGRRKAAI